MRVSVAVLLILLLLVNRPARAEDWPCWRGPAHNGISREKEWLDRWPAGGPTVAWKAAVGTGFSTVAVAGGRLYTLGNRDNTDAVICLDAVTGRKLWSHSYAAALDDKLFDGGPTATPAVAEGRVYTLSRQGDLFCFDATDGKVIWSKNLAQDGELRVPGWGFSGSPLLHENLLLLNLRDGGLALDRRTGETVWTSANQEAGYSSPVPFQRDGVWYAVVSSADAYTAVNLATGKELWRMRWLTRYGLNAADPLLKGDQVLLSSGYTKGAALLQTGAGPPQVLWRNKNLRSQFNSSVLIDGFVYGIDGDTTDDATLRCIDWQTGNVRWTREGIGSGALMAAAGKLIVLSDKGELFIVPATPAGFQPTAQATVLEGRCWTVPVLAQGRIYCRNARGDLICLDVRATVK